MKPVESTAPVPSSEFRVPSSAALLNSELVNSELGTQAAPIHDCWNVIGVEGNGTCRELLKFIHCRNCPVYSAAGIQLLDRPLPADYRRERAEHYALQKKVAQPARLSVVIFRLGEEWLALPTTVFQEVAEGILWPSPGGALGEGGGGGRGRNKLVMHSLPHRRRGLALGLVNVRGELLICASVARLLGLSESKVSSLASGVPDPRLKTLDSRLFFDRLLVTSWNGLRLAFPVDEVHGIQRFPKDELKDPPATISKSALTYAQGVFSWRDRTVGLLDADAFFNALNRSLA